MNTDTTVPAWAAMWTIALMEFSFVKLLTLAQRPHEVAGHRLFAYLLLWPGMNARTFLHTTAIAEQPAKVEFSMAVVKTVLGAAAFTWAIAHSHDAAPLLNGWIGMVGLILFLHFGVFHLVSCAWRRAGVVAPPLMQAPLLARTVIEFWSVRWNTAFAACARAFIFRPIARRWGATRAGGVVFIVSGLIHESVISLPAGGGWGGPTAYFLIQAAGVSLQRSAFGCRVLAESEFRHRAWTLFVTAAPVPLLFHAPFVERVMTPFFRQIASLLS